MPNNEIAQFDVNSPKQRAGTVVLWCELIIEFRINGRELSTGYHRPVSVSFGGEVGRPIMQLSCQCHGPS